MKIMGLGGSSHDFSVCLVENGEIQVAIEDERVNRKKHSLDLDIELYGSSGVDYCLKTLGWSKKDIDLTIWNDILDRRFAEKNGNNGNNVILINHHLAHAASAFYPSPFEEAAILVIDGVGSLVSRENNLHETITYYYAKNKKINEIQKVSGKQFKRQPKVQAENSIGLFYDILSWGLGFFNLSQGKTMGLAPYGTPIYLQDFNRFYNMDEHGCYWQNCEQYKYLSRFIRHTLVPITDPEKKFQAMADIAYAGQFHLEKILIAAAKYLYSKTRSKYLCLAGGVALNSVANYKILEETPFEQLFIQPASGDSGTSIGSALYGYYQVYNKPREMNQVLFSPFLGKNYSGQEIEEALQCFSGKIQITKPSNIYAETAGLLSKGNIIGWYNGRSEIGPRALGNRSIIADSRDPNMKDRINLRIKHRESFRPFAPIVLEEKQTDFFSMSHPSYYMLIVPNIHIKQRSLIPSVCHVDGTGRVQTVSQALNKELHQLLSAFDKLTGVPVLLNTSFNDNGEPIVESPWDAISCFLNIDLDYLVLNSLLISKKQEN